MSMRWERNLRISVLANEVRRLHGSARPLMLFGLALLLALPRVCSAMEPVDVNYFCTPALLSAQLTGSRIKPAQIQRICVERKRAPFVSEHDLRTRLNAGLTQLHPLRFGAKLLKWLQVNPSHGVSLPSALPPRALCRLDLLAVARQPIDAPL